MKEISLHILDLAQNSIRAGADNVLIRIEEDSAADTFSVSLTDDGCGMGAEMAKSVQNPFVTTRTTRKVGLGVPFFKQAAELTALGFDHLPVCMAKTQYSFSDDAARLGAPRGFTVTVRNLKVSAGAGFIVALTGDIMTMPGLPKVPSAEKIDVDENGKITGLF